MPCEGLAGARASASSTRSLRNTAPEAIDSFMMRRHENAVLSAIDDLATRLQSEQSQLNGFNSAIDRVSTALAKSAEHDTLTSDLLMKVVGAIGEAGTLRAASSERTLKRMQQNRSEVDALRAELVRVRQMANTDVLTGLANRRHFEERLAAAVGETTGFALVLADIDHFKSINDTHGHVFGDYVLRGVATTIVHTLRTGTLIARTGGEEFAMILAKAKEDEVVAAAERVRQAIEKMRLRRGETEVRVTISLGAAMATSLETAAQIYEAADLALYRSKNAGRNRVTLHDPSADQDSTNRYRIYGS